MSLLSQAMPNSVQNGPSKHQRLRLINGKAGLPSSFKGVNQKRPVLPPCRGTNHSLAEPNPVPDPILATAADKFKTDTLSGQGRTRT